MALLPRTASCLGVLVMAGATLLTAWQTDRYRGWSDYGGGPEQIRYSTLQQINRDNVKNLQVAWTYDAGEPGGLQTQPIIVDGVLYANTPTHKAFALRAETGERLWTFDAGLKSQGANRGLMHWHDGADRRVYAAVDHYVYAIDAATGRPVASFGENGRIDLRRDLGRDPQTQSVRLTRPGVVYKDLLIIGGRVSEGLPSSPGDIRAYDARTGKLRWAFHTIPHPGEAGYDTWSKDSWRENGGANNWPGMALDEARGIVYAPTGSAAADFYGANRAGDNLYANSLIALNADTGKRVWHFQFVKHDIWDRDPPAPPSLVTITQNGRSIDAVAQATKHGYVFVFDRSDGRPLFPIEYRRFPASDVPGEVTAETQPIPTRPKPFSRDVLSPGHGDRKNARSAELGARGACKVHERRTLRAVRRGPADRHLPGVRWRSGVGRSGVRPGDRSVLRQCERSRLDRWTRSSGRRQYGPWIVPAALRVVSSRRSDWYAAADSYAHRDRHASQEERDRDGHPERRRPHGWLPGLSANELNALVEYLISGKVEDAASNRGPLLKYRFTGYRKFLDPEGYPAVAPPWGTLSAINLNTGEFAWQIPLGEYPELAAKGLSNTGTENYGGPIVTAGGLLFIGATNFDKKFRAFDKLTGELLWETTLPFSGNATPATFEVDRRQFVVIAAGGGKGRQGSASGSVYVAFALPK